MSEKVLMSQHVDKKQFNQTCGCNVAPQVFDVEVNKCASCQDFAISSACELLS